MATPRGTADFNLKTGDDSAVRLNALVSNEADNGGNRIDKGIAPTFRWGIGTRDEFSVGLYHLQYRNGINYGFPWLQNRSARPSKARRLLRRGERHHGRRHHLRHGHARAPLRRRQRAAHGAAHRPLRARPARQRDPLRRRGAAAGRRGRLAGDHRRGHGADARLAEQDPGHGKRVPAERLQRRLRGLRHEARRARASTSRSTTSTATPTVTPAGVTIPAKPTTTIGTPDDGGAVDEALREVRRSQTFDARRSASTRRTWSSSRRCGSCSPACAGTSSAPTAPTPPPISVAPTPRRRHADRRARAHRFVVEPALRPLPADRAAVLPPLLRHLVQHLRRRLLVRPAGQNTPPEANRNVELGGSIDWAQGRFTTRFALFHATKYNERNTDQDSVSPDNCLLRPAPCGRHRSGFRRAHHAGMGAVRRLRVDSFGQGRQGHAGRRRGRRQPAGDDAAPLGHLLDHLPALAQVARRRRPDGAQRHAALPSAPPSTRPGSSPAT